MKIHPLLVSVIVLSFMMPEGHYMAQSINSNDIEICPDCEFIFNGQTKKILHSENSIYISPNISGLPIILNSNNAKANNSGNIPAGIGIFLSIDGGVTWLQSNSIAYTNNSAFADPSNLVDRLGNYTETTQVCESKTD